MKHVAGWWFPGHEEHFIEWMQAPKNKIVVDGRLMYQGRKQEAALGYVKQWRAAVDIGGHVGTWAWNLAKHFAHVHAFEPVAEHRECFALNVEAANVTLHECALGAAPGMVSMWTEEGSSGNTQVRGDGDIPMRTLDSFALQDVDFLKIDCEGFELYVLHGAMETIARCKPVIVVEQKPRIIGNFGFKGPEAVDLLLANGYVTAREYSGDFMMVPA